MNTKPFGPKGKALARITQVIDEFTTSELVNSAFLAGVRYFDVSLESAQVMFASTLSSIRDASILSVTIQDALDIKTQVELQSHIDKVIATLGSTYVDVVLLSGGSMELFTGKTPHFEWLRQCKAKGLIHAFGVSVPSYEEFKWVVERGNVDVIEVKFNLFYQTPAAIFPFVKAKKTVLIAKSPLENGWLSGKTTDQTIPSILNSLTKPNQEQKRSILIERLKKVVRAEDLI
ncbi:MAG: aldo/keto reductase, partial [Candidatus Izemoplasmatales bacterium]|nr:aldo/keto reductase [Candidatus Izemoplasmatales bacterium]